MSNHPPYPPPSKRRGARGEVSLPKFMKIIKFFFLTITIVILYFATNYIFKFTKICPNYIDLMPKIIHEGDKKEYKWNDYICWIYYPITEKVY